MRKFEFTRALLVGMAGCTLAACGGVGGGGGGGFGSTPPPPPPPPAGSSAVNIFPSAATQEFATATAGDDIRIRYDAATNSYEVMAGTLGWRQLVDDPTAEPAPGQPNMTFKLAGTGTNLSSFGIRAHHQSPPADRKYSYSNLAAWQVAGTENGGNALQGVVAFGIPTAAGGVPVAGSATFNGLIEGISTTEFLWENTVFPGFITGTVLLNFNFAAGTFGGELRPTLDTEYDLPTLTFSNTVFGIGSTSFSGKFDTALSGPNSFSGLFTGPAAQELIGKWAFPFISPIDGKLESADGAMIAKRP